MRQLIGLDRLSGWFGFLVFALSAVLILPAAAQAAYPGANGRIAYESNQGGADSEIMSGAYDGSGSTQLTSNTVDDKDAAWSPDGKKIAFARLNSGTGLFEIWTMNADGTGQAAVVTIAGRSLTNPTWKPDGTKIAFTYRFSATDDDLYQADSTGLNSNVALITGSNADEQDPAWSPVNPNQIAYARRAAGGDFELRKISLVPFADTPVLANAGQDLRQPAWSPDGGRISVTYEYDATLDGIGFTNPDGSDPCPGPCTRNPYEMVGLFGKQANSAWAPENNMFAYDYVNGSGDTEIALGNAPFTEHGTSPRVMEGRPATVDRNPDWQPVTTSHVRPKGATPLRLPLTIAYKPCTSPNATHDPPLSFSSCSPPRPYSKNLTVGDPLVNGKVSNFIGSIKVSVLPADAELTVSLTDVRCARFLSTNVAETYGTCTGGPLSDYTGSLGFDYGLQITDRANSGAAGTLQPSSLRFPVTGSNPQGGGLIPCSSTADPSVGSTCSVSTTFNAKVPGLIVAGKRTSWEFQGAVVRDGDISIDGGGFGQPFAVPGTFHP